MNKPFPFSIFVSLKLEIQTGSVGLPYGAGEEGVSSPRESQAAVSVRKENGMMKRQNNGSPLSIHSIIAYLLEVTMYAKCCPRSWEFKDQGASLCPQKTSNFAKERFPDLVAGGWA